VRTVLPACLAAVCLSYFLFFPPPSCFLRLSDISWFINRFDLKPTTTTLYFFVFFFLFMVYLTAYRRRRINRPKKKNNYIWVVEGVDIGRGLSLYKGRRRQILWAKKANSSSFFSSFFFSYLPFISTSDKIFASSECERSMVIVALVVVLLISMLSLLLLMSKLLLLLCSACLSIAERHTPSLFIAIFNHKSFLYAIQKIYIIYMYTPTHQRFFVILLH